MLLKHLTQGVFLLSLVSAFPRTNRSSFGGDDLVFSNGLSIRAEDNEDVICSEETCGDACKPTIRSLLTNSARRDLFLDSYDYHLSYKDSDEKHIDKRIIEKPAKGQLDAWFAAIYPTIDYELDVLDLNDDKPNVGHWDPFNNRPRKIGVKGLYGCTVLVITSSKGAFLAHYWERYFVDDDHQDSEAFNTRVLESIWQVGCLFDKTKDPDLQVALYTKGNTVEAYKRLIKYDKGIKKVKDELVKSINGLEENEIQVIPYYCSRGIAEDKNKAAGKMIVIYDNNSGGGNAAYQVWVGTKRTPDGTANEPTELINDPILSDEWRRLDNQN